MQYKVYELEHKTTANGKLLKKLVLQGAGKTYPDKNVTMWSDHPLFDEVEIGQTIDVDLEVKDSTTPNPHGGFYKNKTVLGAKRAPSTSPNAPVASQTGDTSRMVNKLEFDVIPRLDRILARQGLIMKSLGMKVDDTGYPKMDEKNDAHAFDEPPTEEEIASSIPF